MECQEHWSNEYEHESIATPEAKESFGKTMSKFTSLNDVPVAYMELQKTAGKPFKLPESVDKLPEKERGEFTQSAKKLLGVEDGVSKIEDLADIDLKVNLPEGYPINEEFSNSFKEFVVENNFRKSDTQKLVGFHNQAMIAANQKIEAAKLEAATKTNDALIAHFGSKEKVAEQSELVKRAFQDHAGLTPEEFEQVGEVLADSAFTKNPILAKALVKLVAPLAAEGSTDDGQGGYTPQKYDMKSQTIKESPNTSKALGWT